MKAQVTILYEEKHEISEYEKNFNAKIINLSNLQITEIHPFSFNKYQNVRVLNMSNNTGFNFPVHSSFLYSRNIRYYFCNNCGIQVLYEETFKGLPILSTIELKGNRIQHIMPDTFNYVPKISIINLESNQIKSFNSKGFLNFPSSFHTLSMSNNKEFKLPVNKKFLIGERLTSFECNFCNIQEIYKESFSLVPEIVNIELKNNNMGRIDYSAFESSNKLDYLCLDNNNLSEENFNFTSKSLQQMYCSNCSFTKIKKNTFSKYESLIKLELRKNTISLIEENSFKNNPNLKLIDLGTNNLQDFPINLIKNLKYLKNLIIDAKDLCPKYNIKELKNIYEELKLFGTDFNFEIVYDVQGNVLHKNCPKIQYTETETTIDISNKDITYIDPDYFRSNLTVLQMNYNRNFKFPEDKPFLNIHHLKEYHCNSCGIKEITAKAFEKLPNLIKIDLSNNGIKTIADKSFEYIIHLQDLFLSDNSLSYLNENIFQNNTKLSKLDLSNNLKLSKIPESKSLLILNMSHCQITELSYKTLGHLIVLDLSFNNISSIERFNKMGLIFLKELYLDSNNIDKFPAKLSENENLLKLCLDENPLSFDYNEDIVSLQEIYIKNNLRSHRCIASYDNNIIKFEYVNITAPIATTIYVEPETTTIATTTTVSSAKNPEATAITILTTVSSAKKSEKLQAFDINDSVDDTHDNNIDHKKRETINNDLGKEQIDERKNELINSIITASAFGNESVSNRSSVVLMILALIICWGQARSFTQQLLDS